MVERNVMSRSHIIVLCALFFVSLSECSRILGIFHLPGKSHHTAGVTMMKILAEHGHEVTMVSPLEEKNVPNNFKNVVLTPDPSEQQNVDFFSFNLHPILQTIVFNSLGAPLMNSTFSHPKFKELMATSKGKFDLIIIEQFYSDALRYVGVHLDAPVIIYSAMDANSWTNPTVANPAPPSYVPDFVLPTSSEMTFFQRFESSIIWVVNELVRNFVLLPGQNKVVKTHYPGAPDISEYYHKPSMVLLNGDVSVGAPLPKVPGMVDIGGFHIKPPKPLPSDLQKELDNAKNGVIYFSMGSNIKSANMPKDTLAAIIKVFSKLKETVLWKWEDDNLPGKPNNVITRKWLPQNDLLAHKNIKLFITHGGIFSTMEAVYHGVPCLAFPIFGDQAMNADRAKSSGFARWMKFADITEEKLLTEIEELLKNPKYAENAKKRSFIMRDKPMTPKERLVYWVEYVIRHKGADHLRVAALKLSWYQYLLIDVVAFVAVCLVLFIVVVKYSLSFLLSLCKKSNPKLKKN